jgi:hypothetical protein
MVIHNHHFDHFDTPLVKYNPLNMMIIDLWTKAITHRDIEQSEMSYKKPERIPCIVDEAIWRSNGGEGGMTRASGPRPFGADLRPLSRGAGRRSARTRPFDSRGFESAINNPCKKGRKAPFCMDGGEGGIRTHGRLPFNGFQDRRFRPLSHLSSADLP